MHPILANNNELVEYLIDTGSLKSPGIIEAFRKVDRKNFVPEEFASQAYVDAPLPIGYDQTISQPHTVAIMLEMLQPQPTNKILDVGSGSGWTTALLATIVEKPQQITGVELIPELVAFGKSNIEKYGLPYGIIRQADPKRIGSPNPNDKFDKILVSAGANNVPPELIEQLKIGGRMIIPVNGLMTQIDRISENEIQKKSLDEWRFSFVPLVSR